MHRTLSVRLTLSVSALPNLHAQLDAGANHAACHYARRATAPTASADELDARGDELRGQKAYLDALDYYRAALAKKPSASLYNKAGITELDSARQGSGKDFERAVKLDRQFADAWNNLGVVDFWKRSTGRPSRNTRRPSG